MQFDHTGLQFDKDVRTAGQDCRDKLATVCRWHAERGDTDVHCPPAIKE